MPSLTPVAAGIATATAADSSFSPLVCSDFDLSCSEQLACSDADSTMTAAAPGTGTLVAA